MTVAVIAALACPDSVTPVSAQISGDTIKIGLLTDMSGVYADISGQGGVEAVKMAIADSGGEINGKKIELVYFDHQHKPDIATAKAREWFERDAGGFQDGRPGEKAVHCAGHRDGPPDQ
jgi:branched-chain amino acid transport system substrate-binding protein